MSVNHYREPSATGPLGLSELSGLENSLFSFAPETPPDTRALFRTAFQMAVERTLAADALLELHGLLERHAPAHYTSEQRERVESLLRLLGRL